MPGIGVLPETFPIDNLGTCTNVSMTTDTLRTFRLYEDFTTISLKDCFEVNWVKDMTTLPTELTEARNDSPLTLAPAFTWVRRASRSATRVGSCSASNMTFSREEVHLEDETPLECSHVNSWHSHQNRTIDVLTTCVSTGPVDEPTAMSFAIPLTGNTIIATVYSASVDCTDFAIPACSGSVYIAMQCGGGSFVPDGAYDSLWDGVKPMTGAWNTASTSRAVVLGAKSPGHGAKRRCGSEQQSCLSRGGVRAFERTIHPVFSLHVHFHPVQTCAHATMILRADTHSAWLKTRH